MVVLLYPRSKATKTNAKTSSGGQDTDVDSQLFLAFLSNTLSQTRIQGFRGRCLVLWLSCNVLAADVFFGFAGAV